MGRLHEDLIFGQTNIKSMQVRFVRTCIFLPAAIPRRGYEKNRQTKCVCLFLLKEAISPS